MGSFSVRTYIAFAMRDSEGIVDASTIEPTTAADVIGGYNSPPGFVKDASRVSKLSFLDTSGGRNAFEAGLVFMPAGGATWYLPGGVEARTRAYKDTLEAKGADKLLTVMRELVWWNQQTGAYEQLATYSQAPDDLGI